VVDEYLLDSGLHGYYEAVDLTHLSRPSGGLGRGADSTATGAIARKIRRQTGVLL
jgi:hypothetical protein